MNNGVHLRKLEQESAYDRTRKQWVDKLTGVHAQQQYTAPISAAGSSTSTGVAAVLAGEPIQVCSTWDGHQKDQEKYQTCPRRQNRF